jgi:NADH-quinone oxidoreductase subunit B
MDAQVNSNALRVLEAGLACCGVEAAALDLVADAFTQLDVSAKATAQTHILVIAGTVTHAISDSVRAAYDSLAEPRVVVAFGACAITGGPYWDSYAVIPGADQVVPVDIHVPGCPPGPVELLAAIKQALTLVNK